jgi:hypothetical protein
VPTSPDVRPRARSLTCFETRQLAKLALALIAVSLAASSCGDSNRTTREILKSENPLTSDLYFQIKGPAGAVSYITGRVETGAFVKYSEGFFVPRELHDRLHQQRVCDYAHTIVITDSPKLQPWLGKKMTIVVYGKPDYSLFCRLIGGVFRSGS